MRVYTDREGWLLPLAPGDYGRVSNKSVAGTRASWWHVRCPDGSSGALNPAIFTVVEHEDGTISVTPSIVSETWHGWLKCGVWSVA